MSIPAMQSNGPHPQVEWNYIERNGWIVVGFEIVLELKQFWGLELLLRMDLAFVEIGLIF
jgi:hypothetical protein